METLTPLAVEIIGELLAESDGNFVIDDDTVGDLIAHSGSIGWGLDTYEISKAQFINAEKISFLCSMYLHGMPDDKIAILGTSILVNLQGKAIKEDENWIILDHEVLDADFYSPDYDEYYSSAILSNTDFYRSFSESLEKIRILLYTEVPANTSFAYQAKSAHREVIIDVQQHLFRLLHVSVITALETFLSDAFIITVLGNPALVRKFVESNSAFAKQEFSLKDLFKAVEEINDKVKNHLSSQLWHNLDKVRSMYKDSLGINFPKELSGIFKAIQTRHDLVHRTGKSKSGAEIMLAKENIEELIEEIQKLVIYIDDQLINIP